jgi:hypothetical protein
MPIMQPKIELLWPASTDSQLRAGIHRVLHDVAESGGAIGYLSPPTTADTDAWLEEILVSAPKVHLQAVTRITGQLLAGWASLWYVVRPSRYDAEKVADCGEAGRLHRPGRDRYAVGSRQLSGGCGAGHHRGMVAKVEGAPCGRVDAHVCHEPSQDQFAAGCSAQLGIEVCPDERVRIVLDDDRFPRDRSNQLADLPDLGTHVIRGSLPGVMHDVEDRNTGSTCTGEQPRRLSQRGFDTVQLHDTTTVGVLAVDHDQR